MFDTVELAAGYAAARPAVHPAVIDRAAHLLGLTTPVARALDVGCGAGLSTAALAPLASVHIGVDPAAAMVGAAARRGHGVFVRGAGECLPIASETCDLVSAAGSLPFADLPACLAEAARVVRRDGAVVVYDYGPPTDPGDPLTGWWQSFRARWPTPPAPTAVTPADLAAGPLHLAHHEELVVEVAMDLDRCVAYAMTETNVAAAVARGVPADDIRAWCTATLAPVLDGRSTVRIPAWLALLVPPPDLP